MLHLQYSLKCLKQKVMLKPYPSPFAFSQESTFPSKAKKQEMKNNSGPAKLGAFGFPFPVPLFSY